MKAIFQSAAILVVGLLVLGGPALLAQERGREDRGREGRGDRGREGGRDFDPREILRQADDNNDGVIDPSEVGQRSGYYIRRAAERAGLDPNRPLPADKLMPALEALRAENNGQNNSNNSSSSPSGSSRPTTPTPSAFGGPAAGGKPGGANGFNVPITASTAGGLEKKFDQRVIEYVDDMLRERDANKNGVLEKTEWTGRWSTPPEESDLNKDGILDKEELCVRISKRFTSGAGGGPPGAPGSTTSSGSGGPPPSGPPGGGLAPFGGGQGGDSGRFRGYAEGLLRQYDRNKDGKLERDEFSTMKSDHQQADVNKDGIITVEELSAKLQNYASGSSGGSSSGGGQEGEKRFGYGQRGGGDNRTAAPAKTSFRFTTPSERLPKGMPDWFLRGDVDGDGQVSMAEYTSTWTEQLAAEFLKYDLNGDGIITPEECQAVGGGKK
jgi:Ca2+-binding EF-hand superfamily protein